MPLIVVAFLLDPSLAAAAKHYASALRQAAFTQKSMLAGGADPEGDAWDVRVRAALMTCVGGAIQAEERARQRNLVGHKKKKKKKKRGDQGPGW